MREYSIKRRTDNSNWTDIPLCRIDNTLWLENPGISATAQLCWDEEALYVRLCAQERNIRAELYGQMQEVYEDSCLEFFFSPEANNRYFNFEFNPNEALYLGFGEPGALRARLILKDEQDIFQPRAKRTQDGWKITYRIPTEFIQEFFPAFTLHSSLCLYANFYKCGNKTAAKHYLSWNPITTDVPQFHRPQDFGVLKLV